MNDLNNSSVRFNLNNENFINYLKDRKNKFFIKFFEKINENFLNRFKTYLLKLTKCSMQIKSDCISICNYSKVKDKLNVSCIFGVFPILNSNTNVTFIFECNLFDLVIDLLFGGLGSFKKQKNYKSLRFSERYILNEILYSVIEIYKKIWFDYHSLDFKFQPLSISEELLIKEEEKIVCSSFEIIFKNSIHTNFFILFPVNLMSFDLNHLNIFNVENYLSTNKNKKINVINNLKNSKLEIIVKFSNFNLNLFKILSLKKGDIINIPNINNLNAYINDIPIFVCSYGCAGDYFAIKINFIINNEIFNLIKKV